MTPLLRAVLDVRRHPLGPRVYLAGVRVHECVAGVVATAVLALCLATDHVGHRHLDAAVGVVATWMIAKDWPDFFASRRDTYTWRLGPHRRSHPMPAVQPAEASGD